MKAISWRGAGRLFLALGMFVVLIVSSVSAGMAINPNVDLHAGQQDIIILGDRANGYMSEVTGSADFNGDGIGDLLLGSAGYNKNGSFSGAAFMILGGTLPTTYDLSNQKANLTIYGAQTNDVLGHAVAAGDVNGDGLDDMIVGADGWNNGKERGAVYVFLGNATQYGSPTTIDLSSGGKAALTLQGESDGNRFGRAVAVGDVNGDNLADIVVGAYHAWPSNRTEAGIVYVFLGSSSISAASPTTLNAANADLIIWGAGGATAAAATGLSASQADVPLIFQDEMEAPTAGIGDRLGRSVATGDVNGDGRDDVIAGAYGSDVGGAVDAGRVYVIYGKASYNHDKIDLVSGGANLILEGIDAGDQAGFYVGSGDLNNNNNDEILVGAYLSDGQNNGAGDQAGEVYIVNGGAPDGTISLASGSALTVWGEAGGDRLGRSLASGDLNGDGFDDLILGASRADPGGRVDAGKAYAFYGSASLSGGKSAANAEVVVSGDGDSGTTCNEPVDPATDCADEAGHSVSVGDVNGDAIDDMIVGALFVNNGSIQDAGAAYVLFGGQPHGDATAISVSPQNGLAEAGGKVYYRVTAQDASGATWDVTSQSTFGISSGAGGSWSGNTYTAENMGTWTVNASYSGLNGTASLTVVETLEKIYMPLVQENGG